MYPTCNKCFKIHSPNDPCEEENTMITSYCIGGLANRIKCIISGIRIAKYLNFPFCIKWRLGKEISKNSVNFFTCPFTDLFDNFIPLVNHPVGLTYSSANLAVFNGECIGHTLIMQDKRDKEYEGHKEYFEMEWKTNSKISILSRDRIDLEYNNTPKKIKEAYLPILFSLIPVKNIREKVEQVTENLPDNMVGVHIRGMDACDLKCKNIDFDKYFAFLNAIPNRIFLCSDENLIYKMFFEKYGSRMVMWDRSSFKRDTKGIQEAFIDLLLLSKMPTILGSPYSTFTELAWWYSGCTSKIIIP